MVVLLTVIYLTITLIVLIIPKLLRISVSNSKISRLNSKTYAISIMNLNPLFLFRNLVYHATFGVGLGEC